MRKSSSASGDIDICSISNRREKRNTYRWVTCGRLNAYLADINAQAEEWMILLTEQMAVREGVTEQLKAKDQMLWVQRMNNIRMRAEETVYAEIIDN